MATDRFEVFVSRTGGTWPGDRNVELLADRFDPACGGDRHGNVSALAPAQLDELVAYLESL